MKAMLESQAYHPLRPIPEPEPEALEKPERPIPEPELPPPKPDENTEPESDECVHCARATAFVFLPLLLRAMTGHQRLRLAYGLARAAGGVFRAPVAFEIRAALQEPGRGMEQVRSRRTVDPHPVTATPAAGVPHRRARRGQRRDRPLRPLQLAAHLADKLPRCGGDLVHLNVDRAPVTVGHLHP